MRRRSGLRSFPRRSPSTQGYPDLSSPPDASTSRSPALVPSAASPGQPADRHTPSAIGSTSALRSQLPSLPAPSSCRSLPPPESDATDSPLAQADASCLVPYALLVQCLSSPLAHFKPGTAYCVESYIDTNDQLQTDILDANGKKVRGLLSP